MKMEPRISMITLGVSDLDVSIKFYSEGLGFPQMDSPPTVALFTLNGTWLSLYSIESLAQDADVSASRNCFPGFTLAHNVKSESEVDALIKGASDAGATIKKPASKKEWGGYSGYFADLDGYLWEIAYNPKFWVGPPATG